MKTGYRVFSAIVLLAILALPAVGDVIYDNGGPDQEYIWYSDPSFYHFRVADDFTLNSGANVITDIHWWGSYRTNNTPAADDFTIIIYITSPMDGVVYHNNVGAVSRTDTELTSVTSLEIYSYSLLVDPISLAAGTTYCLEILNNTGGQTWGWSTANSEGGSHLAWDGGWYGPEGEMAFNLTNDGYKVIPEPASIALVGLGMAGLAKRRFLKRG